MGQLWLLFKYIWRYNQQISGGPYRLAPRINQLSVQAEEVTIKAGDVLWTKWRGKCFAKYPALKKVLGKALIYYSFWISLIKYMQPCQHEEDNHSLQSYFPLLGKSKLTFNIFCYFRLCILLKCVKFFHLNSYFGCFVEFQPAKIYLVYPCFAIFNICFMP